MALVDVSGSVVSTILNAYDFVKDGERVVGEARSVWVSQGPEVAPSPLKMRDDGLFVRVRAGGPGSVWVFRCDMVTFDGKTSLVIVAAEHVGQRPTLVPVGTSQNGK